MQQRAAIVDLGTNTFNLLVFERNEGSGLRIIHTEERSVFLGSGGIEHGVIADDAFERGMVMLRTLRIVAEEHGSLQEPFRVPCIAQGRGTETGNVDRAVLFSHYAQGPKHHHAALERIVRDDIMFDPTAPEKY